MNTQMIASYRRIFEISIPIMLSNAMLPLIGMVDAGVIGRLGEVAPLAAVGMGGTFVAAMFWMFNFLDITTTAVVGQARGSGDQASVERHLRRSFVLAMILSVVILLLIPFWIWVAPKIFAASSEITPYLKIYVGIALLATPAAFLGHVITGYLLGSERTRMVLAYELVIQIINLVLDLVFVFGFDMGVAGVALASVIAQYIGLVFVLFLLRHDFAPLFKRWPRSLVLGDGVSNFLQNNGYLFLRALGLHLVILLFYRASAILGDDMAAMNAVLMIFVNFAAQATDGFAVAVEVLVAQSLGAKNVKALRVNILRAGAISAGLALVIIVAFLLFGNALFAMISTNADLRAMAPQYLPWVALAIAVGVISWSLDGIFFGANRGRELMLGMLITVVGYVALLFLLVPIWGNHGLWLAFVGSYALRALGLAMFYPRIDREARP